MNSFLTHLECSRCGKPFGADRLLNLCSCGAPLFARYDLARLSRSLSPRDFAGRVSSLWRYGELLPLRDANQCLTLQEGFTPLLLSRHLGRSLGISRLYFKDESRNPTGSFKVRGLSVAVSKARELGASDIALPSAGNAGGAAATYAALGGMGCHVFMPSDTPPPFLVECRAHGADVRLVDGYITDAAAAMREDPKFGHWFDVSTCKEPYRVEGKKTILFEVAEQLDWTLPDVLIFPTGGGTGIVAAWKAYAELRQLGWISDSRVPRLIAVQASGCAPIVRAFTENLDSAPAWENAQTSALGLRVPKAVADFLILRAIRGSGGTAIGVTEEEIAGALRDLAQQEGLFVAPEAAAGLAALRKLQKMNLVDREDSVLLLLTGSALKYIP